MAATLEQLLVGAEFLDAAARDHENAVGAADRAEPVGDDETDAAGEDRLQAALDQLLGLGVDR